MFRNHSLPILPLLLLTGVLVLSGCSPFVQLETTSGPAPTPIMIVETGGVDYPDVYVDEAAFQSALLAALSGRDTDKLQMWMTGSFLIGVWRAGQSETAPEAAVKTLYADQLGAANRLELVEGPDLKALLGGRDPLSIPREAAGVVDAFLVSGWGQDGNDEAILFVARQADNSLKWHGWMQVRGGFSGERLGGIQLYENDAIGYNLYVPKDYEVASVNADNVTFLAPGIGHPNDNRAAAFIMVEPANGLTSDQLVEAVIAMQGPGFFNITVEEILEIDETQAFVFKGLPGQDLNRQVYMVHNDLLYRMMFVPDNPQATAYRQMEDVYAMILNTFHFTR